MADVLRLGMESTIDQIDLLNGGLQLARGGYMPRIGQRSDQWVQDVINLQAEDSAVNLYSAIAAIDDRLHLADLWFNDPNQYESVWLEYRSDGETFDSATFDGGKRALVRDGQLALDMPEGFRGGFLGSAVYAKLVLKRHRWFENRSEKSISNNFTYLWDQTWNLTGQSAYAGNVPARIWNVNLYSIPSSIDRLWVGIRSLHEGISGFEHIWELEDGTAGTDTSSGADGTASGSSKMTCTFSTSTDLEERVSIELSDVVLSDYDHHVGRYLVLLRCKVGANTTCGVKMSYGMRDYATIQQEEVYIDHTDWLLIELGEIQIPPGDYRFVTSSGLTLSAFTISIEAERISGSGSLELDALCLVPSEHLFTMYDMGTSFAPLAYGLTLPDDTHAARIRDGSGLMRVQPPFTMTNWCLPTDPGILVAQLQTATAHGLTDTGSVGMGYYPRWNLSRSR